MRRRGRHGHNKSSAPLAPPLCKGDAITAHSQRYQSSIATTFALKSNAIKMIKKAEQEKALFYLENKTGLGIFSSGLICSKISTSNYSAAGRTEKPQVRMFPTLEYTSPPTEKPNAVPLLKRLGSAVQKFPCFLYCPNAPIPLSI